MLSINVEKKLLMPFSVELMSEPVVSRLPRQKRIRNGQGKREGEKGLRWIFPFPRVPLV